MKKIKRVSEAFSLQPNEKHVSTEWEFTQKISHIKLIEIMQFQTSTNEQTSFYVGFNFDNEIVFKWVTSACNVEYFDN